MSFTSGSKLGPYEIQSLIGAGGMGEVYRARDPRLQRVVAIKILPQSLASDHDRLDRFQREARILSALNHPNVMAIHDVGSQDGVHFLVSEFLEGQTLRERLQAVYRERKIHHTRGRNSVSLPGGETACDRQSGAESTASSSRPLLW
jgi:serine/threonine protein kinase